MMKIASVVNETRKQTASEYFKMTAKAEDDLDSILEGYFRPLVMNLDETFKAEINQWQFEDNLGNLRCIMEFYVKTLTTANDLWMEVAEIFHDLRCLEWNENEEDPTKGFTPVDELLRMALEIYRDSDYKVVNKL